MPTYKQLAYKKTRITRKVPTYRLDLEKCPQKRGVCLRITVRAPKKPCSANRAVAKISVRNKRRTRVWCHIPGETHNLKRYGVVLIHGAPVPDLPGVKYRVIRNVRGGNRWVEIRKYKNTGYSLSGLSANVRKSSRSKYGVG